MFSFTTTRRPEERFRVTLLLKSDDVHSLGLGTSLNEAETFLFLEKRLHKKAIFSIH